MDLNMQVHKFDLLMIAENSLTVIVGRNNHHNFLVRDILCSARYRDIMVGTVVSPGYDHPLPPTFEVAERLSPEIAEAAVARQEPMRRSSLILLDDSVAATFVDDVNVQSLFAMPPSLFLLAVPHVLELSYVMRACVDYIFLFREALALDLERLFENFAADAFASLDVFSQMLKGCTIDDEHECLVIDRKARNNIRIFWHNAGGDPPRTPPRQK